MLDSSVGKYGRYCCMCGLDLGPNATFQQVEAHDCPRRILPGQQLIPPRFCTVCGQSFHPGQPHPQDNYERKIQNLLTDWLYLNDFHTKIIQSETTIQENGQISFTDTIVVSANDDTAIDPFIYHRTDTEPPLTTIQVLALLIEAIRTIDSEEPTLNTFYRERNYHDDEQDDDEGMEHAREDYEDLQMSASILKGLLPEKEIAYLINEFHNIYTED